jgi:hypothetical protein
MSYGELLDKSTSWDKINPLIDSNELFAFEDLTENDIVVR